MSLLSKLQQVVSKPVEKRVDQVLDVSTKAAEGSLAKTGLSASSLQEDGLDAGKSAAEAAFQKLFGPTLELQAKLPAYDALSPTALAAAQARSPGTTTPQQCISSPNGQLHEPVTLTVTGTQAQLQAALEKAGWVVAKPNTTANGVLSGVSLASSLPGLSKYISVGDSGGAMSSMLLDGKPQVMAFEKNDDQHRGRDHLRVFATGQINASGQPIWAIAATRDTAFKLNTATLSASHVIDHDIDPERNQVMADLLGSGEVANWTVAKGTRSATDAQAIQHNYVTDGNVYQVALT